MSRGGGAPAVTTTASMCARFRTVRSWLVTASPVSICVGAASVVEPTDDQLAPSVDTKPSKRSPVRTSRSHTGYAAEPPARNVVSPDASRRVTDVTGVPKGAGADADELEERRVELVAGVAVGDQTGQHRSAEERRAAQVGGGARPP